MTIQPDFWKSIMRPEVLVFLVPIVLGAMGIIVTACTSIARHRADVDLKRDMVARGMSVEEIERVLAAKSPKKS